MNNRLHKKLTLPLLVLLALIGTIIVFQINTPQAQSLALPENRVFDENELMVKNLSSERGIGIEEARMRIDWQEKAPQLADRLTAALPESSYGGIWIDKSTDRINVGTVDNSQLSSTTIRSSVMRESKTVGIINGVDTVPVEYSYSELMQSSKTISELQNEYVDTKSEWPIQVGPRVELNKIQIDIPEDKSRISNGLKKLLSIVDERYGDQIIYNTYAKLPVLDACNWWFCDSPLRGGVGIKGNLYQNGAQIACTAGFMLRDIHSGYKFLLTDGHCLDAGTSWTSDTYNYTNRYIGTVFNSLYNNQNPIDAMIVRTSGTEFTSVAGTILKRSGETWSVLSGYNDTPPSYNEYYDVTLHATSTVGERICISPAITGGYPSEPNGGSCGEVEQTSIYLTAGGVTTLVHRAGYCAQGGDSGSPIFGGSNNVKGIHRASDISNGNGTCSHYKYYTPISTILIGFANENINLEVY